MKINIPKGAADIIQKLATRGFDAYVVGGCVRDSLIGRVAEDWDITTNALPSDIKAVFAGRKMIDIGERHGTIAVNATNKYYEVTTYRIDGAYGDGRRPDSVSFTDSLREDLARRDFTINAMAYSDQAGLVDYFGGHDDIKDRVIRCVGNAGERFAEDYLRIMRAYRFAATLGFDLAPDVRNAAINGRKNLHNIAVERVRVELMKMLLSDDFDRIEIFLEDCADTLFPEMAALAGYEQNNPYHIYDVLGHSLHVLRNTPPDAALRIAALYHDTGKLHTRAMDADGIHHFHSHEAVSTKIAEKALDHWRFDNHTTSRVLTIIKHHGNDYGTKRTAIKRLLNKLGTDAARDVLNFQAADNMAKSDRAKGQKLQDVLTAKALLEEIIAAGEPVKISDLAITGRDVMRELGIAPSAAVGEHLQYLMEQVIEKPSTNTYENLVELLKNPR
ncbi:MAG: HD domain-containing protein [Defluviitaleaceae bacterium]|nr:HD domain-containing protein [Defluviitaleaceae bacterium]